MRILRRDVFFERKNSADPYVMDFLILSVGLFDIYILFAGFCTVLDPAKFFLSKKNHLASGSARIGIDTNYTNCDTGSGPISILFVRFVIGTGT
jgi:hypothetical protein